MIRGSSGPAGSPGRRSDGMAEKKVEPKRPTGDEKAAGARKAEKKSQRKQKNSFRKQKKIFKPQR